MYSKLIIRCYKLDFIRKLSFFQFDNGSKYTSREFQRYLSDNRSESQTSCACTQEQNSVAECKNRHFLKWLEHFCSKWMFQRIFGQMETWHLHIWSIECHPEYKEERVLSRFYAQMILCFLVPHRVYGCTCFAYPKQQHNKLNPKVLNYIFVGYQVHIKGTSAISLKKETIVYSGSYLSWECHILFCRKTGSAGGSTCLFKFSYVTSL